MELVVYTAAARNACHYLLYFHNKGEKNKILSSHDAFYQKKKKVHFESHVYLGICQKEWVYWDTRRKLLIVYAQKSLEKDIKDKIKDWPCLDKIQMIHIPSSIAFFQSQEYILNQYEWDILWFGPGYLEYGFYIKI